MGYTQRCDEITKTSLRYCLLRSHPLYFLSLLSYSPRVVGVGPHSLLQRTQWKSRWRKGRHNSSWTYNPIGPNEKRGIYVNMPFDVLFVRDALPLGSLWAREALETLL